MSLYTQRDPTTSPTYLRPDDGRPSYKKYLESHSKQWSTLILEICHHCPVACAHCHVGSTQASKLALTENQIESSIREFARFPDSEYVMCTGGEPFSYRSELRIALETIRQCDLLAYTLTSGVWAKSLAHAEKVLSSLPPIDLFAVSIDRYHAEQIGMTPAVHALQAAVSAGYSTFVCIGHMGLNDPFREQAVDALGPLANSIDVIYYPLLARGSGSNLPELEGRELSRPATAPCFSIGAPLVTANGEVVSCCHTSQANLVREERETPLRIGQATRLADAAKAYESDDFAKAIRTVGPARLARDSGLDLPSDFDEWDICRACEYLHEPSRMSTVREHLVNASNLSRLEGLDNLLSNASSSRLTTFVRATEFV